MPERGGNIVEDRIDGGKCGFGSDDQERRSDESFREHDAGKRIGQGAAGQTADPAIRSKQKQQQHAARERRQRQRQLHDEAEHRHLARVRTCEKITERHPADQDHERGDAGASRGNSHCRPRGMPVDARPVGCAELGHAGDERRAKIDGQQRGQPDKRLGRDTLHRDVIAPRRSRLAPTAESPGHCRSRRA